MTSPARPSHATSPGVIALRVVTLLAGVLVLLGASFISLGVALLAPIGMWTLGAWRRRRGLPVTRAATWLAAMAWVAVGLLGLTLVMFDSLPDGTLRQVQHAADSASAASYHKPPPTWVERVAPGTTARAAHGSPTSAGLRTPLMIWTAGVGLLLFASVVGSLGWVGSMLCGYTIAGRWPNGTQDSELESSLDETATTPSFSVPSRVQGA